MAYAAGIALAWGFLCFARVIGFDRDRAFYPILVMIVASYYVLFAVMAGSQQALLIEAIVMILFVVVAVIGFKFSLWLVVAGLASHAVFDVLHDLVLENPGVPAWWPAFCLTFDLGAAGFLAWLLMRPGLGGPSKLRSST